MSNRQSTSPSWYWNKIIRKYGVDQYLKITDSRIIDSIDNLIDDTEFKEKLEKGQAIDVNDVFNNKSKGTEIPLYNIIS